MAITSNAQVGSLQSRSYSLYKSSMSNLAGAFSSYWAVGGTPAAGNTAQGLNGTLHDSTSTGAVPLVAPVGSRHISNLQMSSSAAGTVVLYDRLWSNSGMYTGFLHNGNISHSAITRYTSGEGVQMWLEVYSRSGSAVNNITLTVTYTNSAGVSGRTSSVYIPYANVYNGVMFPCPLMAGDLGVKSIQSYSTNLQLYQVLNLGIVLLKPLLMVSVPSEAVPVRMNHVQLALPEIPANTCLAAMKLGCTTSSGDLNARLSLIEG
jgi:hypothetical protein